MLFEVPELNFKATKRRVIKAIQKYERCLMKLGSQCRPKITPTFSFELPTFGNDFHSSTESTALFLAEGYQEYLFYVQDFIEKLNRVDSESRQVLWYWLFEEVPHDDLAYQLGMSSSKLSEQKRWALEMFAITLDVEVYYK